MYNKQFSEQTLFGNGKTRYLARTRRERKIGRIFYMQKRKTDADSGRPYTKCQSGYENKKINHGRVYTSHSAISSRITPSEL